MRRWGVPAVVQRMSAGACAATACPIQRLANSDGFTLIETIVATFVMVVGLLGAFLMLNVAAATSSATRARAAATNVAREITEDSRAIPWSQIDPSTIVSQLQQFPGLANTSGGSTWQVQRSGFTYTITATACYVDDPKDGYGDHSGGGFCADSTVPAGAALTDPTPIDLKRVAVNVQWTLQNLTHTIQEVATLTSAGQALGLQASALQVATPTLNSQTAPKITSTSTGPLTFQVTAPPGTTAIVWTLNGAAQPWGSSGPSGSNVWTSSTSWNISSLSDGTYTIGAAAEDGNGIIGPAVTMPVVLIRNIPAAPSVPWYGFNSNLVVSGSTTTTAAELRWAPSQESNVVGYRIYKGGVAICSTSQTTTYTLCTGSTSVWCAAPDSCIDLNPGSTSSLTYQIAALYYDANHVLQAGPATSVTLTGTSSNTYTFAPSTGNTSTNCSGSTALADMLGTYTPGGTDSTASGAITFCSDPFASGAMIEGGGTAAAYFANPGSSSCQVTATLSTDGNATGAVNSSATVPAGTSTAPRYTFPFTNSQVLTMNAGDGLDLYFNLSGSGCSSTVLHYGSTGAPSLFQTASLPITPPGAPASLTINVQGSGNAVLTWPESTTGAPVSFYRVYRGGTNYTARYDDNVPTTDCINGTCTFIDSKRPSPPYSYYVTAVGGTTPGSNMAESTETGPATG